MPRQEPEPGRRHSSEPHIPIALPDDLAQFLRTAPEFACVTEATSLGTAYVVKAPAHDIQSLRGRVPIHIQHSLHQHPQAPVIRTVISLYDRPEAPLRLETFINVAAADQRADFARLADQEELWMLFYDERLQHRLTKRVPQPNRAGIAEVLTAADAIAAAIPPEQYDFDIAKQAVMRHTML